MLLTCHKNPSFMLAWIATTKSKVERELQYNAPNQRALTRCRAGIVAVWTLSLFHHDAILWAPRWTPWVFLYSWGLLSCHLCLAPGHGMQTGHRPGIASTPPFQRGWKLSLWMNKPLIRWLPPQTDMAGIAPTTASPSSQPQIDGIFVAVTSRQKHRLYAADISVNI